MNDLAVLGEKLYKVIEINIEEMTYEVVKLEEENWGLGAAGDLREWVEVFVDKGMVHKDDEVNFRKFFSSGLKGSKVFYRRNVNGIWRLVCMESEEIDEEISIIIVRDVEDYVEQYRRQYR